MSLIVVERSFGEATDMQALQRLEDAVASCLEQHRVQARGSLVAKNGLHAVCFYEAPDAESVRVTQDRAGLPFDHIWAAQSVVDEPVQEQAGFSQIVVQRDVPGVDLKTARELRARSRDCHDNHRAHLRRSLLSMDGLRMVCHLEAPDAEGVRRASRESDLPFTRIWPATRIAG
jgi:hypothetical protein